MSGAGAIPGATRPVNGASAAVGKVLPILSQIATYAARNSFRRQLVAAYPHMRALLLELRNGTPAMFEIMERSHVKTGSLSSASDIDAANLKALEKDREQLAGWTVLMDRTPVSIETAIKAAMAAATPADLAGPSEASVELKTLADQVKALRIRR